MDCRQIPLDLPSAQTVQPRTALWQNLPSCRYPPNGRTHHRLAGFWPSGLALLTRTPRTHSSPCWTIAKRLLAFPLPPLGLSLRTHSPTLFPSPTGLLHSFLPQKDEGLRWLQRIKAETCSWGGWPGDSSDRKRTMPTLAPGRAARVPEFSQIKVRPAAIPVGVENKAGREESMSFNVYIYSDILLPKWSNCPRDSSFPSQPQKPNPPFRKSPSP